MILTCFLSSNLIADETNKTNSTEPVFYVGAYLGLNLNSYSADFDKLPGFANCCPKFTGGSGTGFAMGLLFNYPFSNNFSLEGRFGLNSLNGILTKEQIIGNTELRNSEPPFETTDIVDAISEYEISTSIQIIGLEPALKYQVFPNLNIVGGFRLAFMNTSTFDQKETLKSPSNVVFKGSETRVRNDFKNQNIPETNTSQIHLLFGASYHFKIRKSLVLVPDIRYYPAMNNLSSVNWSVNQLQFSLGAIFPFYKPIEIKTIKEDMFIRDTSVIEIIGLDNTSINLVSTRSEIQKEKIDEETILEKNISYEKYEKKVPKESSLSAFLITTGINRDGYETKDPTIVIEETEIYETFPLLPYIFYPENSSDLKATSQKLINKFITVDFKEQNLPQNTFEVYYNLLNVIGARMQNNQDANITVIGTNNNKEGEKNNSALSKQRAESVKNYLVNEWRIQPDRIKTQSRNLPSKPANNDKSEGLEENRRAEIVSSDFDIMKPITLLEISKSADPPKVKVVPMISSDVGIKKWDITISQDNKLIAKYTDKVDNIIWDIENGPMPILEKPIDIELNVADVAGKKISTQKSLELLQLTIKRKREELVNDKRIEKFALILFDYDRADLKPEHKQIISNIKSRVHNNSTVTISGYTDATGEYEYNKELSERRTKNVLKELGIDESTVNVKNIGADLMLFDNSTPYGRSFCRTVTILIETPVNTK